MMRRKAGNLRGRRPGWRRWSPAENCQFLRTGLLIVCTVCCRMCTNSVVVGWSTSSPAKSRATYVANSDRSESNMLRPKFDPSQPYRAVEYLRMSDPGQNKRSPEQQESMITTCLERLGYPWQVVKTYRDEGKSGRLLRTRQGYQQIMRELKSGAVSADLILVDTLERFGRVDGLSEIRRNLFQQYGILDPRRRTITSLTRLHPRDGLTP